MNYIELINQYWSLREQGIVSGAEGDLYMYLLHTSNKLGWKNPFNQSNRLICAYLNISEKSLIKYKNVLKGNGLIDFESGNAVKQNSSYTLLNCKNYSSAGSSSFSSPDSSMGSSPGSGSFSSPGSGSSNDCKNYSSPGSDSGSSVGSDSGSRSGENRSAYIKRKLNKTKQDNSLSLSDESSKNEKERERVLFLEFLFFEKGILKPQTEVERFVAHYEKTGWLDANGNQITNRVAALKSWKLAADLPKIPLTFAGKWRELYEAAKGEAGKSQLMITDLGGYKIIDNKLKLSITKDLYSFLEDHEVITAIKPAYMRMFAGFMLEYETTIK